jgi:hypothetical protein
MIKHIVVWKLKEEAEGRPKVDNSIMLKRELELMSKRIKEIQKLEVGINFNSGQDAYDLSLYSEFASRQDLEAYQNHPEHLRVVALLRKVRDARVVVDYEIPNNGGEPS